MKCNSKFMRLTSIATVALVAMTSCSDDDKNYPADVYLTGTFEPVQVVGASGTKEPGSTGSAAFNITFDAAGDWSISAHNLFNPQETAGWVKFFTNAGSEGCQLVGVYADANPSTEERAATIEINCKGTSVSFTLIQQAIAGVVNPNTSFINKGKTVTKIVYGDSHTRNFTYSTGNILDGIEDVFTLDDDKEDILKTTITSDARVTPAGIAVNKVVVTSNQMQNATYGVVNGKIAVAYMGTNAALGNTCIPYTYGYNASGNLTNVTSTDTSLNLGWTNGNLTSFNTDIASQSTPVNCNQTATYGNELNNANIDLVWFLNLTDPGFLHDVAPAMNLMGVRSLNLPDAVVDTRNGLAPARFTYTYSDGVTDEKGNTVSGLTMTTNSGDVVKVYYGE